MNGQKITFFLYLKILLGSSNGIVKTFDVTKGEFIREQKFSIGDEKLKGLFQWDE